MSQKSLILNASFFLGIKAMKVVLRDYCVDETPQKWIRHLFPQLSNTGEKNAIEKPSEPKALSPSISLIT